MSDPITISGADGVVQQISEAKLVFSLSGAWHVEGFVASQTNLAGAVTITVDTLTLQGTVDPGGLYVQALHLRVVAGAGAWTQPCTPKYYQNATLGFILADLLQLAGEQLSSDISPALRNTLVLAFPSTSGSLGENVATLINYAPAGTSYRFLPDGTFWIGAETWPAFTDDYTVTSEEPRERRLTLGALSPTLMAGQAIEASTGTVHCNRVEWSISADAFRAVVWLQPDAPSVLDRFAAAWGRLLNRFLGRAVVKTIDACALYSGRVVKVSGALVDIQLDTAALASPVGVTLLVAIPGALTLAGGEGVLVGFKNGDPSQPYVFGMLQGTIAAEATIAAVSLYLGAKAGAKAVVVDGDQVNCGILTITAVANGVFIGTYVDPFGTTTVISLGTPIPIKGKTIASTTHTLAA